MGGVMHKKGMLIVLSGPSGAGKDSILKKLLEKRKNLKLSISYTTRTPRDGEVDGKDYYFVDKNEFENLISDGKMLEYASYCNNYYGTPKFEIENECNKGYGVILEIEVQGAGQVLKKCPEALSIFIVPPSLDELKRRLVNRGLDDDKVIEERILTAQDEIKLAKNYKYVVVNDNIDICVENIIKIIDSEYMKLSYSGHIIEEVLKK